MAISSKDLAFYENNIEHFQFLKTCLLQAESFYKFVDVKVYPFKDELVQCFFLMERAKNTNELKIFFSNLHKQIEILVNFSLENFIGMPQLLSDLENKEIKAQDEKLMKLWSAGIFYIREGISKDMENFKRNPNIGNLSFSAKMNIFYVYFIDNDLSVYRINLKGKTIYKRFDYSGPLPIIRTNQINTLRNKFNHGGFRPSPSQQRDIDEAFDTNEKDIRNFYIRYYKILVKIYSVFQEQSKSVNLLI